MISNTSPIIFLAKINSLDLSKNLYGHVIVTPDVREELLGVDKPDIEMIRIAFEKGILTVKNPRALLDLRLGGRENSSISLAAESKDILLLDDLQATRAATALGIRTLRTTTVLFSALKRKFITKKDALAMINQIIDEGYYIAPRYYKDIIDRLR